ncbi:hypothetical protein [Bartonella sp. AU18XJBT]|uniref:hypothetical protein n=1 Tax=Bartonella sp. AU18XJBT TaxID=3019089 RepID=UPI00235F2E5B|nr:hypothetical protein [Bartonella sp. AU18XJBT]
MRSESAVFILFLPVGCFLLNAVTVFAIFVNMIIVAPYYSLIKHLRLYYRVKKQRRLMKEQPQHFCFFEKSGKEKERVPQNLALETQISFYSLKKWLAFSRKDYILHACLSFIIMFFKAYVYVIFFKGIDESRFEYFAILLLFWFFLSVCIFATIPVGVILREILTHRLKKKIQQLEEVTEAIQ